MHILLASLYSLSHMHMHLSGDILAKSFKWIYAKCFLCRICPNIARRRLIREKQKEKLSQQSADETVRWQREHKIYSEKGN